MSICVDCLPECDHDYCDNCAKCHDCGQYAGAPSAPAAPPDVGISRRREWLTSRVPVMFPSGFDDRTYDAYRKLKASPVQVQLH